MENVNKSNNFEHLINIINCTVLECPWTKSLKIKRLLNFLDLEFDELSNALEKYDINNIYEEIGDVFWNLCLLVFLLDKINFKNNFNIIFNGIINKMIKRYTWVSFPNRPALEIANNVKEVEEIWNRHHDNNYGKIARLKRDISRLTDKKDNLTRKRRRSVEKINKINIKLFETINTLNVSEGNVSNVKKNKRCGVFCSNFNHNDKKILSEILILSIFLTQNNIDCINDGNNCGYMKILNKCIFERNGKTIGIVREDIVNCKNYNKSKFIDEVVVSIGPSSDINDKIKDLSNVFIALPGGFETINKIYDIINDISNGLLNKPIFVVNINGFYNDMINQIKKSIKYGFINKEILNVKNKKCKIFFVNSISEVINRFKVFL